MIEHDNNLSPRSRRMAKRREQILDAAAGLFAEQGFHRTTTRDIADAADIAEGTLYNYFTSKEDLLLALMSRLGEVQEMERELTQGQPATTREFIVQVLDQRKENFERSQTVIQSLLSEILVHPELRAQYHAEILAPSLEMLERNICERMTASDMHTHDPRLLARMITGLVSGLFLLDMLDDPVIDAEWPALSKLAADILFTGLAPDTPAPEG